jgi:hypothetical protein
MFENALSLTKMYPNQRLVNKHFIKYLELQVRSRLGENIAKVVRCVSARDTSLITRVCR